MKRFLQILFLCACMMSFAKICYDQGNETGYTNGWHTGFKEGTRMTLLVMAPPHISSSTMMDDDEITELR